MVRRGTREPWEIRDDARTLAQAEEIRADKERYLQAVGAAKDLVRERERETAGLRRVAGYPTDLVGREFLYPKSNAKGRRNPATIREL